MCEGCCNKIERAYQRLRQEISEEEIRQTDEFIDGVTEMINKWDRDTDINFIYYNNEEDKNHGLGSFYGKRARKFSNDGMGSSALDQFTEFMKNGETIERVKELFSIKKYSLDETNVVESIISCGLLKYKDEFDFSGRGMPNQLTQRVELIIFPELFTTTANFGILKHKAKLLDIKYTTKTNFEDLQRRVREKTDECLKMKGLFDDSSTFVKAAVAWFVE